MRSVDLMAAIRAVAHDLAVVAILFVTFVYGTAHKALDKHEIKKKQLNMWHATHSNNGLEDKESVVSRTGEDTFDQMYNVTDVSSVAAVVTFFVPFVFAWEESQLVPLRFCQTTLTPKNGWGEGGGVGTDKD